MQVVGIRRAPPKMVTSVSPFTSGRERRLWFWTLAALVAIYATLGPARTLADALRERNLLQISFALVVLLVVVALVAHWVKSRPAGFMVIAARLALAPQRGPGWRVWFLWLIANAWGWGVGMFTPFGQPGGIQTLQSSPAVVWAGYLSVAWGAVLVGGLEWLVIRQYVERAIRWVPASVGASAMVGVVVFGVGAFDADAGWVAGTGLFGTAAGVLQWLVLRGQVPGAGWWVLASTVGWVAGIPMGEELGWNGLGAGYGLITGTVLVLLLRRRKSRAIAESPQVVVS